MNCLARRKTKRLAWSDPNDPKRLAKEKEEEKADDVTTDKDLASGDEDEDEDDYEMYANDVRSKKISLESKELHYKHLTNINNERSYKGAVKVVQFHPKSKIALVGLGYRQIDLYEVDGERNRYIQNIKAPYTKDLFCSFHPDGNSVVIASETYRGFYNYDMLAAKPKEYSLKVGQDTKKITDFTIHGDHMACRHEGRPEVFILSSKTYELMFTIKINEPVKAMQFTSNKQLLVAGENAQVYIWDVRKTTACKHRFQDEGSVHSASLAFSESSNQLSIGSDSGIVNSYQLDHCLENKYPQPVKTFANLKTQVDLLTYNNTGELLLMGSRSEAGAFRLVHSLSGTVYKNFPVPGKKYGHLLSAHFSPQSGYLGLGCSNGRAHLCRLPYYKSY